MTQLNRELDGLTSNRRFYDQVLPSLEPEDQAKILNGLIQANRTRMPGRAADTSGRARRLQIEPALRNQPNEVNGNLFTAHVMRDIGLVRVGEHATEWANMMGILDDFNPEPGWAIDDFIDREMANRNDDIPDWMMAKVIAGDAPFDRARSDAHMGFLIGMVQQSREFDTIISNAGMAENLLTGFAAQFVNPLNYVIPMAMATKGIRTSGAVGRFLAGPSRQAIAAGARQRISTSVTQGFVTATVDETILFNLDYGDRTWQEAAGNILLSTAFDFGVNSTFRGVSNRLSGLTKAERQALGDAAEAADAMQLEHPVVEKPIVPPDQFARDIQAFDPARAQERINRRITPAELREANPALARVIEQNIANRQRPAGLPDPTLRLDEGTRIFQTEADAREAADLLTAHDRRIALRTRAGTEAIATGLPAEYEVLSLLGGAGFAVRRIDEPTGRLLDAPEPTRAEAVESTEATPRVEEPETAPTPVEEPGAAEIQPDVPSGTLAEVRAAIEARGVSGDDVLNTLDLRNELDGIGAQISPDGIVTLFHRTSREAADRIIESGRMSGKEDRLFFGTEPEGEITGFGEAIVQVAIPIERLSLDDIFGSEAHVTIESGRPGTEIPVEVITRQEVPDDITPQQTAEEAETQIQPEAEAQAEIAPTPQEVIPDQRTRRELVEASKELGLKATGKTADIRARVLESEGPRIAQRPGALGAAAIEPGIAPTPRAEGAIDPQNYELITRESITGREVTSGQTTAVRAVGDSVRGLGFVTTNPATRLMRSGNIGIRAAANRLFTSGQTLQGADNGTTYRGSRWDHGDVEVANNQKKLASARIADATGNVITDSLGLWKGAQSNTGARIAGRTQFRNAVYQLVDQTAAEAGLMIRLAREADPSASMPDILKNVQTTLTARLSERLETDVNLKAAGVDAERIKPDAIANRSVEVAQLYTDNRFDLNKQALVISRRLDAEEPSLPRMRKILKAMGETEKLTTIENAVAEAEGGFRSPESLDAMRIDMISQINEQRLSLKQLAGGMRDDLRAAADRAGVEADDDAILAAIYHEIDPDIAPTARPELVNLINEFETTPADLSIFRNTRASLTKTINIDGDARINAGLHQAMVDTLDELLIDPVPLSRIQNQEQQIQRFISELGALTPEFGLKPETAGFELAARDLRDLEASIRLQLGLGRPDVNSLDKTIASVQSMATMTMLSASQPALMFEAAQVAATTGGFGAMVTKHFPGYLSVKRELDTLSKSNPEQFAFVMSAFENMSSVTPVKNRRSLERMGISNRADLPPEKLAATLAGRMGGLWMGLVNRTGEAVLGGDVPGLSRVPVLRRILRSSSFDGMADGVQKVAFAAHAGNVWDMMGDFIEIENAMRLGDSAEAAIAKLGDKAEFKGLQPLMVEEVRNYLAPDDLDYLSTLRKSVDDITSDTEISIDQQQRALRELGVVNLAGFMIPIDRVDTPVHNKAVKNYHELLDYLVQDFSTTTPRAATQPLRVAHSQFAKLFYQFMAFPATFVSSGLGAKMGLFDVKGQATLYTMLISAAMLDKLSRQWSAHGWEEGNERIADQWENQRTTFVADVVGRTGFLGVFEKLLRPTSALIDGKTSFDVGMATEHSFVSPTLAYVKMLSTAIASLTKIADERELTPRELRNLERITIVRNTMWARVLRQVMENDETASTRRVPRRGATRRPGPFRSRNGKLEGAAQRRQQQQQELLKRLGAN